MEAKLAAYRIRKRKEAMVESVKSSVKGVFAWGGSNTETIVQSASSSSPPAYVNLEVRLY